MDPPVWHKLMSGFDEATIAVSEVVLAGHVVGNAQGKPIPQSLAAIEQ